MEKTRTLYSWIGSTDIRCYTEGNTDQPGPLAQAVLSGRFERVRILSNWKPGDEGSYIPWLLKLLKNRGIAPEQIDIELQNIELNSPTDFTSLYRNLAPILGKNRKTEERTYHLSPGTPAMASLWIILSSGEFPAALIETSRESGLKDVELPFHIRADFISDALNRIDARDREKNFEDMLYRDRAMKEVLSRAIRIAGFNVPVIIFGESGTGKELVSRGIHKASGRRGKFIAVNCGAIPGELVESEFFGHREGSFTGAVKDHRGYLQQADGGTLFLDEIGELPLDSQVKLLRALNNSTIRPIGGDSDIAVDIRVIAATNRNLRREIEEGRFREDLFHRLAVGIINMPPLRERGDDLTLLINSFIEEINRQFAGEALGKWEMRRLSPRALEVLVSHDWPGNVRELKNTLKRLVIWAEKSVITGEEAEKSLLLENKSPSDEGISVIRPGFDLNAHLDAIKKKWLIAAKEQSHGNITEAARLLGISNYQTLDNWYRKMGLK